MNDQMRAEFLEAFRAEYGVDIFEYANTPCRKAQAGMAIWAWEASRAAVNIKLPYRHSLGTSTGMYTCEVVAAIRSTGIKAEG